MGPLTSRENTITRHPHARGASRTVWRKGLDVWAEANCESFCGTLRSALWEWEGIRMCFLRSPLDTALRGLLRERRSCPGISAFVSPWVSPDHCGLIVSSQIPSNPAPSSPLHIPESLPSSSTLYSPRQVILGKSVSSPPLCLHHCLAT